MSIAEKILNREQLGRLPEPSPLIRGTIDRGTVAVLAGYWGTCKSFLAQHWSASVATGTQWQGRDAEGARVLYVAAEGAYGLNARFTAWETAWDQQIPPAQLAVLPAPVHLGNTNDVLELAGLIQTKDVGLLVIDTLARCIPGMDENSAKDMGVAVANLYRLRSAMGDHGTVLALHHTGKDKATVRGSSALEAGVDTVYVTEGDPDNLTLKRTKRKDGPVSDQMTLRLSPVDGTKSAVLNSHPQLVVEGSAGQMLSHFRSHFGATGATSTQWRDSLPDMPPTTFYRQRNALVDKGLVVNEGTDTRPFYRLSEEVSDGQ